MSVNEGRTLLSLLVPSSLTEESPDPRIKTYKVGQVARAAAIFRVDEINYLMAHRMDSGSPG